MQVVYQIENIVNGKKYIGSTHDYEHRKKNHLYYLRNNKHTSSKMQKDWDVHGEDNFTFSILENCDNLSREETYIIEEKYIEELNVCKEGYNTHPKVTTVTMKKDRKVEPKDDSLFYIEKKIRKFGNSKGIFLPQEFLLSLGVELGDFVYLTYDEGKIIIEKEIRSTEKLNIREDAVFKDKVTEVIKEYFDKIQI